MTDFPEQPDNQQNQTNPSEPEISQATGSAGFRWVGQSFSLFSKSPSIWVVILIIYFGITLLLAAIPILVLLPTLLAPIFHAGFIFGAKALDDGKMLEIDHLFAGFKLQLRTLFRLGMLYFLMNLLIIVLVSIFLKSIADDNMLALLQQAATSVELEKTLAQSPEMIALLLKALMAALILSIPLVMASWFAPALVIFHQMPALRAMLLSIKACNRNMLPFLFYGLLMIPLLLLALLPFGLGLLIMIPVIFIGQYCSYKAIFSQQQNQEGVFLV